MQLGVGVRLVDKSSVCLLDDVHLARRKREEMLGNKNTYAGGVFAVLLLPVRIVLAHFNQRPS